MRFRSSRDPFDLRRRYPPPAEPFAGDYGKRHTGLVEEALDSPQLLARFDEGAELPKHYGVGLDERVVEYPWAYRRLPAEARALDAGSTLNHAHVLDRVLPRVQSLTIVTLAPEQASYPERGISYVYGDLRRLPFRSHWFDVVVSISTLEHVGMDNAVYGDAGGRTADPDAGLAEAVRELTRVLRPGGTLLVTVPVGRAEDHAGSGSSIDAGSIGSWRRLARPPRPSTSTSTGATAGAGAGSIASQTSAITR